MLDKILEHMKPGEYSLFSFQLHAEEQTSIPGLPHTSQTQPLVPVMISIRLTSFQEVPEIWELNPAQLVDCAKHHKGHGVRWYKSGHLLYALRRFTRAMRCLLVVDKEVLEKLGQGMSPGTSA